MLAGSQKPNPNRLAFLFLEIATASPTLFVLGCLRVTTVQIGFGIGSSLRPEGPHPRSSLGVFLTCFLKMQSLSLRPLLPPWLAVALLCFLHLQGLVFAPGVQTRWLDPVALLTFLESSPAFLFA